MTLDSPQADLDLLRRFCDDGDASAFAEIVQRYTRVVFAAALRIIGDEGSAADIAQETFFRLMQQPKLVTISLAGWLHRTATHLALDVHRSEKARKQRERSYGEDRQLANTDSTWAELSPLVDQALDELREPQRSLLIRHFLAGVPQAELALELNVSPATLSRRVKAALTELQEKLKRKGVIISAAALAALCIHDTTQAAPVALLGELSKMQMIAGLRQLSLSLPPSTSRLAARFSPKTPPTWPGAEQGVCRYLPSRYATAFFFVTLIVAIYFFSMTVSLVRASIYSIHIPSSSVSK